MNTALAFLKRHWLVLLLPVTLILAWFAWKAFRKAQAGDTVAPGSGFNTATAAATPDNLAHGVNSPALP